MNTAIYLIRHAQAAAAWGEDPDPGLSEVGQRQALMLAQRLVDTLPPRAEILSSPMRRAQQTAAPLATALSKHVSIDPRFREVPAPVQFVDRQDWIQRFIDERWSKQDDALQHWRSALLDALRDLAVPTVIVTHFVVINAVVSRLCDVDKTVVFSPDYTSITRLDSRSGQLKLITRGEEKRSVIH